MIPTNDITRWLRNPQGMQQADYEALRELRGLYPSCSVFHYLLLPENKKDYAELQQLLPANHLLVQQWLQQPLERPAAAPGEIVIEPVSQHDYFREQGVNIPDEIPGLESLPHIEHNAGMGNEQSLLVMMSFSEWLSYLNEKTQQAKEEEEDKKALKTLWQKQKLAAAIEEENEEIPDQVFAMAVNSIAPHEDIPTEALANVYALQGKKQKAIEMYKKLGLLNPEKNAYFARKIESLQKEI